MNKKVAFVIGLLAAVAAAGMFIVGSNSSHMSELKQFWWTPAIIAIVCFIIAGSAKKNA
jgi:hypothetical protein